ncbi:MAG TPA: alpha/beta fold hydrolase [Pilimelia sp.]|nr:alpha/beta fold hydrolase [Pilimelia sp.]
MSGVLQGRYPYVTFGAGPHTAVVLPGMALDNGTPGRLVARSYAYGFRRLARDHTVYVVHRGHGLPPGAGTRDIAADYARLLRAEVGPARVLALSTGGLIAQHLALDHADLVHRLALVVTGARLAPAGVRICRRWRDLAAAGRWRLLRGDMAAAVVDGPGAQWLARAFGAAFGGAPPAPVDLADFRTTVDAVLGHDTLARLPALTVPTLLIGGADDPFFPAAALRETAAASPGVHLRVHDGAGHGLPKQRAALVQEQVVTFFGARQ